MRKNTKRRERVGGHHPRSRLVLIALAVRKSGYLTPASAPLEIHMWLQRGDKKRLREYEWLFYAIAFARMLISDLWLFVYCVCIPFHFNNFYVKAHKCNYSSLLAKPSWISRGSGLRFIRQGISDYNNTSPGALYLSLPVGGNVELQSG